MCLLDDVCLIESEVLAPPTSSTFERSITKLASCEHDKSSIIVRGSMIGSHHWKKAVENSRFLWRDSLRSGGQESGSISVEDRSVEYSWSRAAGYLKIGRITKLAMQSMDNCRSNGEYYCRFLNYWVYALIRQYLTTGRKYALIKKYALNKDVRLLTRLYGI